MPIKKKSPRTTKKAETIATETNDTRLILVILLLVLVYPVGIGFMWFWMRQWPTWLKIIISLPFAIGLLAALVAFVLGMILVGRFSTDKALRNSWENDMRIQRQKDASSGARFYLSPTPTVTISPSVTPNVSPTIY